MIRSNAIGFFVLEKMFEKVFSIDGRMAISCINLDCFI